MKYLKKYYIFIISLGIIVSGVYLGFSQRGIDIRNSAQSGNITLQQEPECNGLKRPLAVMVSSDPEARPLSGLSQAEMVFEMPVTDNGITRMMAVFRCSQPSEIGSIRSARLDFIPLAQGLGAIYAHWGGEHQALDQLNGGVINNIDGLKYDGTTYYRKKAIHPPHNGFTSFSLLKELISKKGYASESSSESYIFDEKDKSLDVLSPAKLYKGNFEVDWTYQPTTNSYLRKRAGTPEVDHTTGKQVEAKNLVFMHTTWAPISKDYIRVNTTGTGSAKIYQNGRSIIGTWKKASPTSKLFFYDEQGKEVHFVPGQVWVEITI